MRETGTDNKLIDQTKNILGNSGTPDKNELFFSENLLAWYRKHKRDLPWRRTSDPYAIWVSEVMLQQTRVETVIPYWHRFLEKFPTVQALAGAPEEEVLKAWEGLGYYSRARNLQSAVREVHERYGGVVPDSQDEISTLKGVGPYTSGAVLSIAYNKPEPAVDGNVMRVFSRYFLLEDDIAKPSTRIAMEKRARKLIPEGAAGDFNQALMELGATVCTPRSPLCLTCPVMERCEGRMAGREQELPVKTKAKPPRPEKRLAALVIGQGEHTGKLLIRQRPQEGLLARMWELPHVLLPQDDAAPLPARGRARRGAALPPASPGGEELHRLREALAQEDGLDVEPVQHFMNAEHAFSHILWQLDVYSCRIPGTAGVPPLLPFRYRWMAPDEMGAYAFPNVFIRIIQAYFEGK